MEFSASYQALKNDDAVSVTVHCTIFGSDVSPNYSVKLGEVSRDHLKTDPVTRVINAAGDFGKIWNAAGRRCRTSP